MRPATGRSIRRSSYDLALAMGVDAVEPDIVVSQRRRAGGAARERDLGNDGCRRPPRVRRPPHDQDDRRRRADRVVHRGLHVGRAVDPALPRATAEAAPDERLVRRPAAGAPPARRARPRARGLARAGPRDRRRARDQARHLLRRAGLGCRGPRSRQSCATRAGPPASCRSRSRRSSRPCCSQLQERGIRGTYIYLLEAAGRPFDLVAALGKAAPTYKQTAAPAGLDRAGRHRRRDQRRQADDPGARQARPHDRAVASWSPTRTRAGCGCSPGHAVPRTRSSSGSSGARRRRRRSATGRRSGA